MTNFTLLTMMSTLRAFNSSCRGDGDGAAFFVKTGDPFSIYLHVATDAKFYLFSGYPLFPLLHTLFCSRLITRKGEDKLLLRGPPDLLSIVLRMHVRAQLFAACTTVVT